MIGQSRCQQRGVAHASVGKMMDIQSRTTKLRRSPKKLRGRRWTKPREAHFIEWFVTITYQNWKLEH